MSNFVDIAYLTPAFGRDVLSMKAILEAVPLPFGVIDNLGLRVTLDTTGDINPVIRLIRFAFGPSITATALAEVHNDGTLFKITVVNRGLDYIRPPVISLSQKVMTSALLQAFLRVNSFTMVNGGSGYTSPPDIALIGGLPPANFVIKNGCVSSIYVLDRGLGYPMGTTVTIEGGGNNGPPDVKATATCTVDEFGRVTSVTLTNMGAGYVKVPEVQFHTPGGVEPRILARGGVNMAEGRPAQAFALVNAAPPHDIGVNLSDPGFGYIGVPNVLITGGGGTGAIAVARMELDRIDILSAGKGYTIPPGPAPTVIITPYFKTLFPDTSNQAAPFRRVFEPLFVVDAVTPITSLDPVLS